MDSSLAILFLSQIKKINTGRLDFFFIIMTFYITTVSLYLTILSFSSQLQVYIIAIIPHNSQNCVKNIFEFSVVEISFHRNPTKTGLILFSTGWLVALPCCIETNTKMKSRALHPMTCIHIDVFSFKEFLKPHESDWEWHAPPLQW